MLGCVSWAVTTCECAGELEECTDCEGQEGKAEDDSDVAQSW